MKKTTSLNSTLPAVAFLLIGTLAVAQTTSPSQKIQNGAAAKGIGSAGVPARNGQNSDLQRKDGAINSSDYGHVSSARIKSHPNSANNRLQNDGALDQNSGKSGTNPMYESGKQAAAKPNTSTKSVVEYKDPEDMTTRSSAGTTHGADGGANASAHAVSKHAAGVKYQNHATAEPAGHQSSSSNTETFRQDFGQVQANKR